MAMRAGLFVLISILFMTVDHRERHLESIRAGLSIALFPLHYLVALPAVVGNWASEALATRTHLVGENSRLRTEHLLLEARLQKYAALESENIRLRDLLQSSVNVAERVLIAELLAVDFDPFKRQVLLNKGTESGVFEGHPLIDANGVMGQVMHVTPFSSTAILLTDPSHALPVQVNRNGLRAIALGIGEPDLLELPHIPNSADIRVGDLLVTSGLDRRFPPGYPAAMVTIVEKDSTLPYARVQARPTADLERIREALLVWPNTAAAAEAGS
jgi:rod shape-determining protein MreC